MLPVLGDMDPSVIEMSDEEIRVEQVLEDRSNTRIGSWPLYFAKGIGNSIRRAAFITYWLCKCIFGEAPYYSMKPLYFRLVVKISFGHRFPLLPCFLVICIFNWIRFVLMRSAVALVTLLLLVSILLHCKLFFGCIL